MSAVPLSADLHGQPLISSDGETVGKIDDVYIDPGTGEPEFLEVKAGRFRPKVHFVPVVRMSVEGGEVRVPYDKARIIEAPQVGVGPGGGELTGTEEAALREYWDMPPQENPPL